MKITRSKVKVFKLKNRKGFAALYCNHLTEGKTGCVALDRMAKALRRSGIELK